MSEQTEDVKVFGAGQWVYCNQHLAPHITGWCTVDVRDKIGLGVSSAEEAREKCKAWGLRLYSENYKFTEHTHINTPSGHVYISKDLLNDLRSETERLRRELKSRKVRK